MKKRTANVMDVYIITGLSYDLQIQVYLLMYILIVKVP